ncbi:MAG: ATP-binding cassette domain-containing protein, partial [Myxococcota bacterium]
LTAGSCRCLVGPSGGGKTRLLRALAALDPASGTLRLRGKAPEEIGYPEWRASVLWVPQRPGLHPGTVDENLRRPFSFRAHGAYPASRVEKLLALLRLPTALLDRPSERLSEGERQRVCLLRALLLKPTVLLLDEPTSALDADAVGAVETLLQAELASGRSALVVSHDHDQIDRLDPTPLDVHAWQAR